MARQTPNPCVVGVVPSAIENPVGLKTYIVDSGLAWHQHGLIKTGVTCSTE
jgi:hypothetical protein